MKYAIYTKKKRIEVEGDRIYIDDEEGNPLYVENNGEIVAMIWSWKFVVPAEAVVTGLSQQIESRYDTFTPDPILRSWLGGLANEGDKEGQEAVHRVFQSWLDSKPEEPEVEIHEGGFGPIYPDISLSDFWAREAEMGEHNED